MEGTALAASEPGPERHQGRRAHRDHSYLEDDERKALLAACKGSDDRNIYCAVMLALATGARASNLRNLTWADVDLKYWRLRFTTTKNDRPRFVLVVGPAQRVLQERFDHDPTQKGWVFKGARDDSPADLDGPWRTVRKAAGLVGDKDCRFHDLRHNNCQLSDNERRDARRSCRGTRTAHTPNG